MVVRVELFEVVLIKWLEFLNSTFVNRHSSFEFPGSAFPEEAVFFGRIDAHFEIDLPAAVAAGFYAIDIVAGATLGRAAQSRYRGYAHNRYIAGWRWQNILQAPMGVAMQDQLGTVMFQQ